MWVKTTPPPARAPALDDQVVAFDHAIDARGPEPGDDRGEAIALLHSELMEPAHPRRAGGERRGDRKDRIFVDHRGGAGGGNIDPFQCALAHPQVRHVLAALDTPVEDLDMRAHLFQRREKPGPQRVHHHAFDHDVRPRNDQGGDDRERGG